VTRPYHRLCWTCQYKKPSFWYELDSSKIGVRLWLMTRSIDSPWLLRNFTLHPLIHTSATSESSTKYCSWVSKEKVEYVIYIPRARKVQQKKRSQWLHRCSWKNRVGVVRTFGSYQSATTRTSQLSPLLPLHLFPRFWLGRLLMNCPQYKQSKRALWYFAGFTRPKSWGNRQTICKNLWCGHSSSTKW